MVRSGPGTRHSAGIETGLAVYPPPPAPPTTPMKQLLQNVSSGDITVEDVPPPARHESSLLVATRFSLLSAGTERAVMELGKSSLAGKARARPDLVRKVLDTAREEGVGSTIAKVRGRLAEPNSLGYSAAGIVLEAPEDSPAAPGDLVACA